MTTVLGSTHVDEQLSFSMFPSTLAFGVIFDFLGPNGLFLGWDRVRKLFSFVVYSCSCSTFILYDSVNSGISFCLILGSSFNFLGS